MLRKLNQKAGFTLAETLVTILILLMVSSIVAGGIPAATNAYYKAVDGANAQVLLSTAATALRDELGTARDITVSGTGLTYYNRDDSRKSMISLGTEDILLTEFVESTVEGMQAAQLTRELVSRAAATARLHVKYSSISYDNTTGIVTVSGLQVTDKSGTKTIVQQDIKIQVIAP